MARAKLLLLSGCSFHITLRCNSRQFLIAKALRRDVLLAVLKKAQQKFAVKVYGLCLMANHLHLLVKPADGKELPRVMHWFAWYSAMALNRLSGRCGHLWEARYFSTPIHPKDHRRVLYTLRYIHANPKAAGARKGFFDPYSNYGHYSRLRADGITEWSPAFLKLSATLDGCAKRYRHHSKAAPKCHWGSRMLKRLVSSARTRSKKKRVSPGQQRLPWDWDVRLNQSPEDCYLVSMK